MHIYMNDAYPNKNGEFIIDASYLTERSLFHFLIDFLKIANKGVDAGNVLGRAFQLEFDLNRKGNGRFHSFEDKLKFVSKELQYLHEVGVCIKYYR